MLMTSAFYCYMIENVIKPAIIRERPGKQTKGVILLYDNALSHSARPIWELGRQVLPDIPNIQDLISFDRMGC